MGPGRTLDPGRTGHPWEPLDTGRALDPGRAGRAGGQSIDPVASVATVTWLVVINLMSTCCMTGVIWFVQLVHYPLLSEVPVPDSPAVA